LLQAAIAYYRAKSRDRLLKSANLFADLIVKLFKKPNRLPYRMNRGPLHLKREHPNHELAMIELYRLTGNRKYLDFAKQTLDEYDYCNQQENSGHVVQETLLDCAAADLYIETGDPVVLADEDVYHRWRRFPLCH
jgi:DUF1680 family protein